MGAENSPLVSEREKITLSLQEVGFLLEKAEEYSLMAVRRLDWQNLRNLFVEFKKSNLRIQRVMAASEFTRIFTEKELMEQLRKSTREEEFVLYYDLGTGARMCLDTISSAVAYLNTSMGPQRLDLFLSGRYYDDLGETQRLESEERRALAALRGDPTGITLLNAFVVWSDPDREGYTPVAFSTEPGLFYLGAKFARDAYKKIYPLTY